ncbi:hypothetical protein NVP1084O_051 [Vibrio phage 1.084.O._10N.261.49.F5]|nr:hypothetical protein NVP1084O_051 [Vibrio phage 1.084.O._10N.261.49.F5]
MNNTDKSDNVVYKTFFWSTYLESWSPCKTKSGNSYFATYTNAKKAARSSKNKIVKYKLIAEEEEIIDRTK